MSSQRIDGLHIAADGHVTDEFTQALLFLAAGKPAAKLSDDGIRAYAVALSDVPVADVRRACLRALRELPSQWLPSPAELRQFVTPLASDAALLAWVALNAAAREAGAWADVEIGDPAAAAALLQVYGNWPVFCAEEDGPAMSQHRAEFLACYRAAARGLQGPATRLGGLLSAQGGGSKVPTVQVLPQGHVAARLGDGTGKPGGQP